jgi:methyl-accepting chemotaxis protein
VNRTRLLIVGLAALVLAGCGSSPREVSKAEYEREVQRLGEDLTAAGSELGKSIAIATFNQNVENLQDHLRDAADDLHGLKPAANVQAANDQLADGLDEFADILESVKEARRKSIVRARIALGRVARSAAVREARGAVRALRRRGYDVGQFGTL